MPLLLTVTCFSKIQIGLPFWYRLTRVVPDKRPLNGCVMLLALLWIVNVLLRSKYQWLISQLRELKFYPKKQKNYGPQIPSPVDMATPSPHTRQCLDLGFDSKHPPLRISGYATVHIRLTVCLTAFIKVSRTVISNDNKRKNDVAHYFNLTQLSSYYQRRCTNGRICHWSSVSVWKHFCSQFPSVA